MSTKVSMNVANKSTKAAAGVKKITDRRKLTVEMMASYIDKNAPWDKKAFKKILITKGKATPGSFSETRSWFIDRYLKENTKRVSGTRTRAADIVAAW